MSTATLVEDDGKLAQVKKVLESWRDGECPDCEVQLSYSHEARCPRCGIDWSDSNTLRRLAEIVDV